MRPLQALARHRRAATCVLAALAASTVVGQCALAQPSMMTFTLTGQSMIAADVRETAPDAVPAITSLLKGDVVFTNFEGAVLDVAKGQTRRDGRFGTPPESMDALRSFGFNMLSLSNNHSFDLKAGGVATTIAHARRLGMTAAGTGSTIAEAAAPQYFRTSKGTVALIAIASGSIVDEASATATRPGVNELRIVNGQPHAADAARILASIREARKHADVVVVSQHNHAFDKPIPFRTMLLEQLPERLEPPAWLRKWTRQEIDAGAHIISMHGAPMMHGVEIYKGQPIFYGLGNFIFQAPPASIWLDEPIMFESVVAYVDLQGGKLRSVRLRPIALNKVGKGQPDMHDQATVNSYLVTRGLPAAAPPGQAHYILERLGNLSRPFRTEIVVNGDSAEIRLRAPKRR